MSSPHWAHLAGWREWDLPPGRRGGDRHTLPTKAPSSRPQVRSSEELMEERHGGTRGLERRSSRMSAALQENSEKGTRKHPRTAATGGSPAFSQLRERQTSNPDSAISACGRASKRRRGVRRRNGQDDSRHPVQVGCSCVSSKNPRPASTREQRVRKHSSQDKRTQRRWRAEHLAGTSRCECPHRSFAAMEDNLGSRSPSCPASRLPTMASISRCECSYQAAAAIQAA
jgi:hypothetical protein